MNQMKLFNRFLMVNYTKWKIYSLLQLLIVHAEKYFKTELLI